MYCILTIGELCSTLYIRVCAAGIGEENKEGRGGTAKDDDENERRLSSLDVGCSPLYKPMVSISCCTSARISALLRYFVSSLVLSFLRSLVLVRSLVRTLRSSACSLPLSRTSQSPFLVRSLCAGTLRKPALRFIRAHSPAFPIDRSNGTLPPFPQHRARALPSRACTRCYPLLPHLHLPSSFG